MNVHVRAGLMAAVAVAALAAEGKMVSVRSEGDAELDTNPKSSFWQGARPVVADLNNFGKPVAGIAMEVRSRWTDTNLYFLFTCPYQELYLKPNPVTSSETNKLWNWDVAEVFIGSDFKNIRRYKEFELSPQREWLDLDIDLTKPHHEEGWTWNSGFQVAARIDEQAKIWYGAMKIPWTALDETPPSPGKTLRVNFFRSQGPRSN